MRKTFKGTREKGEKWANGVEESTNKAAHFELAKRNITNIVIHDGMGVKLSTYNFGCSGW